MSETVEVTPAGDGAVAEPVAEAVAPAFEQHTDTPTLLEGVSADKPAVDPVAEEAPVEAKVEPEVKPAAEAKAEPEAKPESEKSAEEAPVEPVPVVYEFTMPEGIAAKPEAVEAYTNVLREHGVAPEVGQRLLEMHAETMQAMHANALADQHRIFKETRAAWNQQIKDDPDLGGDNLPETLRLAARGRDSLLGAADHAEFETFLRVTGAGDHPVFLRLMRAAGVAQNEPAAPPVMNKPPPNNGARRPDFKSIYTHPSSLAQR